MHKLVANNTVRVIHAHYKVGPSVLSFTMRPGLNTVPLHVLQLLLNERSFHRLVDSGKLSKTPGDIDAARDVAAAVLAGEVSKFAPPPEPSGNMRHAGLKLANNQAAAIQAAQSESVNSAPA